MQEESRKPLKVKLGYCAWDLSSSIFFTAGTFLLLNFLTDKVGLSAALAGVALMIGKVWDAVTDPAVGYLSDRTKTKWGRRRPWILFASIPFGLSFLWMFTDPQIGVENQTGIFLWATLSFMLLCTFYTFANVPYNSLLPDITKDFNERTEFMGYRTIFAVIGTFIGAGASVPIIKAFEMSYDKRIGYIAMGAIFGMIIAVAAITPFFAVKEPPLPEVVEKKNIFKSNMDAFRNKPFMLILIPWFMNSAGVAVILTMMIYYFKYIYQREELVTIAMIVLLVTTIVFVPITLFISKRFGKRNTYIAGMSIVILSLLVFSAFAHTYGVISAYIIMAFAGIGFSTHYILPWSIVPDTVDYDYAKTGIQREGIYYGLWSFVIKVGAALAGLFCGVTLSKSGYIEPISGIASLQPESALLGIRLLIGPGSAIFFLIGNIVLAFYPIDKKMYDEIKEKIKSIES